MVQILTAQINDFIANDRFHSNDKTPVHQTLTRTSDTRVRPQINIR